MAAEERGWRGSFERSEVKPSGLGIYLVTDWKESSSRMMLAAKPVDGFKLLKFGVEGKIGSKRINCAFVLEQEETNSQLLIHTV